MHRKKAQTEKSKYIIFVDETKVKECKNIFELNKMTKKIDIAAPREQSGAKIRNELLHLSCCLEPILKLFVTN